MLRKKICTMLAAVMIATTVLGNNVQLGKICKLDSKTSDLLGLSKLWLMRIKYTHEIN